MKTSFSHLRTFICTTCACCDKKMELPMVAVLLLVCEQELHKVMFGIDTAYGGNTSLWR